MAEGLWLLTPRGRTWVAFDGYGSAYQELVDRYRQNLKNVREYPTKPTIQELLLASLPTINVMPEEKVRKELDKFLAVWQVKHHNKENLSRSAMPTFPRRYEGTGEFTAETLYRQMLNDNSSDFKNLVISIPREPQEYLDIHVTYQSGGRGGWYGHLVGRYQFNSYSLVTSNLLD